MVLISFTRENQVEAAQHAAKRVTAQVCHKKCMQPLVCAQTNSLPQVCHKKCMPSSAGKVHALCYR